MTDEIKQPTAHTKDAEITLDQLGAIQPGLAGIMLQVSERYWIAFYAAKAGNWKLAGHELGELKKNFNVGMVTRPKYAPDLTSFAATFMADLDKAIKAKDWKAFEGTFHKSITSINDYHKRWGHGEITWQLPPEPPKYLKLEPES